MIRVLLVHDHALTRDGPREILQDAADVELVAEAADARAALALAAQHDPDVMVMDLDTPGVEDFAAIKRRHAHCAGIPTVVLTAHPESVDAGRLLRTGARGYVAAEAAPAELIAAVRAVHAGQRYVCRRLQPTLGSEAAELDARDRFARLTPRERQVFHLLATARSTSETATALGLSGKTVSVHRAHILAKLRLRNNVELARFAFEHEPLGG